MLKRDKNGFITCIESVGFSLDQFEVFEEDRDGNPAFVLKLINSPLEFWTRNRRDSYTVYDCAWINFGPNLEPTDYYPEEWTCSIKRIYELFKNWLQNSVILYLEELTIPDLWDRIEEERKIFDTSEFFEDDFKPFTIEEQKLLATKMDEFRDKVIDVYKPTQVQLRLIDEKIDYMKKSVERLNRFDWKGLFIGTLIGIATNLCLDTNTGRVLLNIAKQVFSNSLKLLQ